MCCVCTDYQTNYLITDTYFMRLKSELLAELHQHPDVILLMQEVQAVLAQETEKRRVFRESSIAAEFINGEIVYHSPVRRRHWKAVGNLYARLHAFVQMHDLGEVGSEKVMIGLTRNDYEPDIVFFGKEKTISVTDEQLLFPAPDFVVEVLSDSTEKTDRNEKFVDYAAHGVAEYWIIDPEKQTVEQYLNRNQTFELFQKLHKGNLEAVAVPGFAVDLTDIFA